jgi:hypothetical protein
MAGSTQVLIDLDAVAAWPNRLTVFVELHHDLFLRWEQRAKGCDPKAYDRVIEALGDLLQPFTLRGWHCTRLTDEEITAILDQGLQLPTAAMLHRRIDAVVTAGALHIPIAAALKAQHQAADANRAGKLWFCFFPPRIAGERGIERFFRHWGGEALYNSHEDDPVTSAAIRVIGTPSLVEADVPISALFWHALNLAFIVVRRFLISRGFHTTEPIDYEDRIIRPLPADRVRRVIRFPEPDFMALTGCAGWKRPL